MSFVNAKIVFSPNKHNNILFFKIYQSNVGLTVLTGSDIAYMMRAWGFAWWQEKLTAPGFAT